MPNNSERATRAIEAIEAVPDYEDDLEYAITDLMTDLLHLANQNGLNGWGLVCRANGHYNEEWLVEALEDFCNNRRTIL